MSTVELDSGCCGEDMRNDRIHPFGVFTFCFPVAIVFLLLRPLMPLIARTSLGQLLSTIARANARLVADAQVFPRGKCRVAAAIYTYSPRLSGFVFRHFNFLVFLLVTLVGIIGGYGALRLIWRS